MQNLKLICAIMATTLFALFANASLACGDGKTKNCHCAHKCHCGKNGQNCKCAKAHNVAKKGNSNHHKVS